MNPIYTIELSQATLKALKKYLSLEIIKLMEMKRRKKESEYVGSTYLAD